jgi:hypothetical protein
MMLFSDQITFQQLPGSKERAQPHQTLDTISTIYQTDETDAGYSIYSWIIILVACGETRQQTEP